MSEHEIVTHRVSPNGVELAVHVAGEGPLVVLIHGFPELAYSWRHQIGALAAAGHRVIAPDMRGYGSSEVPTDVDDYSIFELTGDIVGLIRHFGGGPAVVVGHDWGAMVAWSFAQFRPDLLAGVVGMSVPFVPPLDSSLIDLLRSRVGPDDFQYILYFQEPGVAEAELEHDTMFSLRHVLWRASGDPRIEPATSVTGFLSGEIPGGLPDWMTAGDFNAYAEAFLRNGFTGPINWYRNLHRNWELTAPWRHGPLNVPAAFIAGRRDPVLTRTSPSPSAPLEEHPMLAIQRAFCPQILETLIDGGGHWIQQEKPDEVNSALLAFCRSLDFGR